MKVITCTCCLIEGLLTDIQVGVKGNPKNVNRGLDCDVIVAEVGGGWLLGC